MIIVSKSAGTTFQPTCDTANRDKHLWIAGGRTRIQRTFSKFASKSNKEDKASDVNTTSSSKKLSGCLYGFPLPETPTVCTDTPSPTCTANANRNKLNRPYYSARCDTMSGTERYAVYRCTTKKINSSCEYTTDSERT